MAWKQATVFSMAAAIALGVGCGNNNEPSNIITPNNTAGSNNNSNNTTAPTNNTSNNPTNNTTNNPTNNTTVVVGSCTGVENLMDASFDEQREFRASEDVDALSCRLTVGELASDGAHIVSLRYSEETEVTISVAAVPTPNGIPPRPGLELRKDDCDAGEVVFCDTASSYTEVLAANTTYFLVANGLLDSSMDLTIEARPTAGCTPGEATCAAGTLSVCADNGFDIETIACPGDCDGNQCAGTACTAPLAVAPTLNGPAVVVEGSRETFAATWDANAGAGCETEAGSGPATSPGPEMFVLVQGVLAGQTVTLSAEQSELAYAFFILDSCTATTCVDAFAFDVMGFNQGSHVAAADGDVLVAFEALGTDTDRAFTLEVSLSD